MERETLISCEGLYVGYDGKSVAGPIDLTVETGDFLSIVGENGAGKTTFVKTLLKLIKPISGKIHFSQNFGSGGIGYVPQKDAIAPDFPASVWETVISGCLAGLGSRFFYREADKAKARSCLEKTGLSGLERRSYKSLSGGQQKRALIARALCAANCALLLDEPAAGLDEEAEADLHSVVRMLNDKGLAIIMVTHDKAAALEHSNKVLHIGQSAFLENVRGIGGEAQ
ncbi:MAG TPA: ABC transporter [Spirochaetaceae bacterium]|nr:ABC transporter [Spirochaetaceae bacterium]